MSSTDNAFKNFFSSLLPAGMPGELFCANPADIHYICCVMKMWQHTRKFLDQHLIGVLGTVIFHLCIILLFMVVKVTATYREKADMILLDFSSEPTQETEIPPEEQPDRKAATDPDEQFWHNIAVNQARAAKEDFDLDKFVDQVRQELLEEGSLNKENWEEGKLANNEEEIAAREGMELEKDQGDEGSDKLSEMANNYTGATTISYYLPDRNGRYLPLPIYKCLQGGRVVVNIEVNQEGQVVRAEIDKEASGSQDPCLQESALDAAKRSLFTISTSAPARQAGTISYIFQAQQMR